MSTQTKPPFWFRAVAVIALLWNAMGVMAYLMRAFMSAEARSQLPTDQQAYLDNLPAWYTAVFALAVFGGTLASLMLLLRKSLAYPLFVLSFLAVIAQWTYDLVLIDDSPAIDAQGMAMAIMIPVFALALVFLAKSAKSKGWIN